jgi:enoyl-CoA hydratase
MTEVVLLERPAEGVVLLRINRPEARNALNLEVRKLLAKHLTEVSDDTTTRAVVLTGSEKSFAAGADIKEMAGIGTIEALQRGTHKLWRTIAGCAKPVIAAVSGYALGGGCELAMACDYRIASERAVFGQPEILLGIIPGGGGTQRLSRLVGPSRAKDIILTGRQVKADEALRIGLCNEVVPPDALHERALALAGELARGALAAQALGKRAVDLGLDLGLPDALALERELFVEVFRTEDSQIGVQSFLEHGPGQAAFTGR